MELTALFHLVHDSGFCNCYSGFTGEDCRVNMTAPPVLATEMSNDSLCDTGSRACNYISVFGENFYISNDIKCRIENAEVNILQTLTFPYHTI